MTSLATLERLFCSFDRRAIHSSKARLYLSDTAEMTYGVSTGFQLPVADFWGEVREAYVVTNSLSGLRMVDTKGLARMGGGRFVIRHRDTLGSRKWGTTVQRTVESNHPQST